MSLNDVYIQAAQGKVVPLSAIAHYEPTTAPLAVNHQGQYPSVTISFNLAPGVALSDASRAITRPGTENGHAQYHSRACSRARCKPFKLPCRREPMLIITALLAVYIVLGILYESYHSSDHDYFHPSLGGSRCRARPHDFSQGPEHYRADWHHSVDRYRQEKRHSDDRFCAGRRTQ